MTVARKGDWIETYTGRKFWPLDPRPKDICIEDIAHALSLKCRFAGHCREFYSVAQHSILVANHVPYVSTLWGLLHDAAEAYLPDVCRPVKRYLKGFRELEESLMRCVAAKFKLSWPMPDSVKEMDMVLLATERRDLMPVGKNEWGSLEGVKVLPEEIGAWTAATAERLFLRRFEAIAEVRKLPGKW